MTDKEVCDCDYRLACLNRSVDMSVEYARRYGTSEKIENIMVRSNIFFKFVVNNVS
jgi:hypothetical protein